jgi:seryl-tRNA synthetase
LAKRDGLRRNIGNFLHESVPKFEDEKDNVIERTIGPVGDDFRRKFSHVDLIVMIDGVDYERGVATAGNRCYYLKGPGVALEQACVAFAQDFLSSRGSTFLSPPVFMNKDAMSEVAQLSQFAEELYKVSCRRSEVETESAEEEKFLIATAEQPIAAFHRRERFKASELPIRYAGLSECFRQEVGSSGRDSKGIFRVHQFKKVEQFCITQPEDSWAMFDEMIGNAEAFTQALGLSYQLVNIVSGDLNLAAAKKFDLEAWFPGQGNYRELVSCSNCTDYQSRRLDIKFGAKKQATDPNASAQTPYVHMLNSTLCATTRVICCILESYQVGDFETGGGIVVPEVLRKYMPACFGDFIPFVKAPPDEELKKPKATKKQGGGKKK